MDYLNQYFRIKLCLCSCDRGRHRQIEPISNQTGTRRQQC